MAKRFIHYQVPEEDLKLPALKRPAFGNLLNQIRKRHPRCGIIVASPLVLSPTEEGFNAAMRRLRLNLIEVCFGTDPSEEELEAVRNDERIEHMVREIQTDGTAVEFHPASACPWYHRKDLPTAIVSDRAMNICLVRKDLMNDAAHELAHRLLELEGYPAWRPAVEDETIRERRDRFDHVYSMVYSSVLDIEVDKRMVRYGFAPREVTDRHARSGIERMKKEGAEAHQDEAKVLSDAFRDVFRHYSLSGELKEEYFDALKHHPPVYDLAMEVIGIIDRNGGTHKPEHVKRIFKDLEDILGRFHIDPFPFE